MAEEGAAAATDIAAEQPQEAAAAEELVEAAETETAAAPEATALLVKPKGKAKGKAKVKAKAKGFAARSVAAKPKPKAKAMSLRTKILLEISNRDIDEVFEEAKRNIQTCKDEIIAAEAVEADLDEEVLTAQRSMKETGREVREALDQESTVLAKLKAAKLAMSQSASGSTTAEQERVDALKVIAILELEQASRQRVQELQETRQRAQEAAEAAKRALEESKLQEKEVKQAMKRASEEQRDRAEEALQAQAAQDKAGIDSRKAQKVADKAAARDSASEIAQIETARAQRERERQQSWRVAAGLKKANMKALANAPYTSPKRPSLPMSVSGGTPKKSPRIVD